MHVISIIRQLLFNKILKRQSSCIVSCTTCALWSATVAKFIHHPQPQSEPLQRRARKERGNSFELAEKGNH